MALQDKRGDDLINQWEQVKKQRELLDKFEQKMVQHAKKERVNREQKRQKGKK